MKIADAGDLAQRRKTVEKVGPAFLFDSDGKLNALAHTATARILPT